MTNQPPLTHEELAEGLKSGRYGDPNQDAHMEPGYEEDDFARESREEDDLHWGRA